MLFHRENLIPYGLSLVCSSCRRSFSTFILDIYFVNTIEYFVACFCCKLDEKKTRRQSEHDWNGSKPTRMSILLIFCWNVDFEKPDFFSDSIYLFIHSFIQSQKSALGVKNKLIFYFFSNSRSSIVSIQKRKPASLDWSKKDQMMLCQAWDSFVFPEVTTDSDEIIVENFCKTLEQRLKQSWKSIKHQLDLLLDHQEKQIWKNKFK